MLISTCKQYHAHLKYSRGMLCGLARDRNHLNIAILTCNDLQTLDVITPAHVMAPLMRTLESDRDVVIPEKANYLSLANDTFIWLLYLSWHTRASTWFFEVVTPASSQSINSWIYIWYDICSLWWKNISIIHTCLQVTIAWVKMLWYASCQCSVILCLEIM